MRMYKEASNVYNGIDVRPTLPQLTALRWCMELGHQDVAISEFWAGLMLAK